MFPSLPHSVQWLFDVFEAHDKELFLVGGCVRDALLHRELHDYDFTTNATPDEMIVLLSPLSCKIIPTGIKHGTLTILYENMSMEVTTYRYDGAYTDHRRPQTVSFTSHLKEDLARRDFTINAMAWHPKLGLIDPFCGQQDLAARSIQCVGEASNRFAEDALRILRALRFSFQLHFTIESTCWQAIQTQSHLLEHISKERIREEFSRMLLSNHPDLLQTLYESETLYHIIPQMRLIHNVPQETDWHLYDVFCHTDIALNHTNNYDLCEKLAIVLHDLGKADTKSYDHKGIAHFYGHPMKSVHYAKDILQTLTYPRTIIQKVLTLIQYHDYYVLPKRAILRKFLAHIDTDYAMAHAILRVQYADDCAKNPKKAKAKLINLEVCRIELQKMEQEQDQIHMRDLMVNGRDMITLGYQKEQIGKVLHYLYEIVLQDPTQNNKKTLIDLATSYAKTHVD